MERFLLVWDVLQVLLEPDHKYVYIFGSVYICGTLVGMNYEAGRIYLRI